MYLASNLIVPAKFSWQPDITWQPPTPPHPITNQGERSIFPSRSVHQSAPQERQISHTPPPDTPTVTLILDPKGIDSIPRPSKLSQRNLRSEMRLDQSRDAQVYYNRIRVSILLQSLPHANSPKFQNVVRSYMSEWDWMDWSALPDKPKKTLFHKVGLSVTLVTRRHTLHIKTGPDRSKNPDYSAVQGRLGNRRDSENCCQRETEERIFFWRSKTLHKVCVQHQKLLEERPHSTTWPMELGFTICQTQR